MIIDRPEDRLIPGLKKLWQQAFGDPVSFIDGFFAAGFAPERCRCLQQNGQLAAALYWFDCTCAGQKLAYVYAVATDTAFRRQGLCHALMEDTLRHLKSLGYAAALLVPADGSLRQFYARMGFRNFGGIREFTCTQGAAPVDIRRVSPEEYALMRKGLLSQGSVLQEGATLAFLNTYTEFYAGEGTVFTLFRDGDTAYIPELLGDAAQAPGILTALNIPQGRFRVPGSKPFAMYYPLQQDLQVPDHFGLALD